MNIIGASILTLVALGIILVLGYFLFINFTLSPESTPFLSISILITLLLIFASFDLLKIGTFMIYVCAAFYCFHIMKFQKSEIRNYLSLYEIKSFLIISVIFITFFAFRSPFFTDWDEYSHWGPFLKSIKQTDRLHIFLDREFVHQSYPQGLSLFFYFFTFLIPEFKEELCYSSYSIVIIACSMTILPHVKPRATFYKIMLPVILVSIYFLFPYSLPYTSVYSDAILGAFFGALLITIIKTKHLSSPNILLLLCCNFAFIQIKDMSIVFSLICLFILFIRLYIVEKRNFFTITSLKIISSLIIGFSWWKILLNITRKTGDQLSDLKISNFVSGLIDYFQNGANDFSMVFSAYLDAILNRNIMFEGISTVSIFIFLLIVSLYIFKTLTTNAYFERFIVALFPICFLGYLFVLLIVYETTMSPIEALEVNEFSRYVSCFLIAWVMLLLYFIINSVLHIAKLIGRVCGAKQPHSVFEQPIYTMSM